MSPARFVVFSVIGGTVWVFGFILLGYFFGNLPVVEKNFSLVILGIVVVTFAPVAYEAIKHVIERKKNSGEQTFPAV